MRSAKEILDGTFMEMRWRALSLAADLDRIQRSPGGEEVLRGDLRLGQLREAMKLLVGDGGGRAERVQLILSDKSPAPNSK